MHIAQCTLAFEALHKCEEVTREELLEGISRELHRLETGQDRLKDKVEHYEDYDPLVPHDNLEGKPDQMQGQLDEADFIRRGFEVCAGMCRNGWTRLTHKEQCVLSHISRAWSAFLTLHPMHMEETDDFRRLIHSLQLMIMCRPERPMGGTAEGLNLLQTQQLPQAAACESCGRPVDGSGHAPCPECNK